MTVGSVPVLEAIRPPPGFRTVAALGTTYSVHLAAAAVALGALDGQERQDSAIGTLAATRALHNLGDRVRIAFHPGRAAAPAKPSQLLVALDEVVRPVLAFRKGGRCFHPKVWICRQESRAGEMHHVLVLGSRNLTLDRSWEFGLALSSTKARAAGSRKLGGLDAFVQHVCTEIEAHELAKDLSGLDEVFWELPENVEKIEFSYHPGLSRSSVGVDGSLYGRVSRDLRQLLVLSPFVSRPMLDRLASDFPNAEQKRLVAGRTSLDEQLAPERSLPTVEVRAAHRAHDGEAVDLPPNPEGSGTDPVEEEPRGLHAKVLVGLDGDGETHLLFGSSNFTDPAWANGNAEANVLVRGTLRPNRKAPGLYEALVDWSNSHSQTYLPPAEGRKQEEVPETKLERVRALVSSRVFWLFETPDSPVRVKADEPLDLRGLSLTVRRLTSERTFAWSSGAFAIEIDQAPPWSRSRFLVFCLDWPESDASVPPLSWVQDVEVTPEIPDTRNRQLFSQLLRGSRFLAFLQSIVTDDPSEDDDEQLGDVDHTRFRARSSKSSSRGSGAFGLELEPLLRYVAQAPGRVEEISRTLNSYRSALAELNQQEDHEFRVLFDTWSAISEGMSDR